MELIITTSLSKVGFSLIMENSNTSINCTVNNGSIGTLYDVLKDLAQRHSVNLNQIKSIYIDIGPGGTSSIRAGVAVGNAISYITKANLFPVVSSRIILQNAIITKKIKKEDIICLHRAVKGNVFLSLFNNDGNFVVYYGLLSKIVSDLILKNQKITILTDEKTHTDIMTLTANKENYLICECKNFGVDLLFFANNRCELITEKLEFPNLIIPFTENHAENYV